MSAIRSRTTKRKWQPKRQIQGKLKMRSGTCKICDQELHSIRCHKESPVYSKEESVVLSNEKLSLLRETTTNLEKDEYLPYKVGTEFYLRRAKKLFFRQYSLFFIKLRENLETNHNLNL